MGNLFPSYRRMPESSGRLRAPTFGGGSTTFWIPACAGMTIKALTGPLAVLKNRNGGPDHFFKLAELRTASRHDRQSIL